jgi:hypothetical protein
MTQIGRPSRGSRGASVLETGRACSGGGFSGNHWCSCNERSLLARRWWVEAALAVAASVAGSHVSPQVRANPKTTASVRCLCNMPQPRLPSSARRRRFAHRAHRFSRYRPARGERTNLGKGSDRQRRKSRQGSLGETSALWGRRRSRSVQVSCGWLASSEHTGLLPAPQGVAQARVAPVTAPPGNGVSLAGRVRDCVVRARVLIVKTDAEGAQTMGAPSSTLRQQKSGLGGRPTPRGGDRSSAEGEERFGARWNGLTNEPLVVPPVRHHGPGATDAVARVLATLGGPAGSPALPSPSRGAGLRAGAPKRVSLAQVCEPLR